MTAFIFISCDEQLVSAEYMDMPATGWAIEDIATFQIEPQDTINKYNLFINLRNTHEYEYNNLWLISQIKFPQGKVVTDTLQYQMAAPDGKFLGKGSNDVFENKLWLREGIRFRESGNYQLALKHAMRKNGEVNADAQLKGILNVGYSIEKQLQDGSN
ncbi:gliding motility lipoprotein GldH [Nonlabens dokdonensis]|uniref:Gliding motility lipoprotein GldH n=1 Tax=Nonlabens dokdonensis TaxID=328515 RepID=A0A1Z8B9L7_9FLAO|nr:gliding motility lipoprotein GldH [Nonlabens dokdonensis]